MKDYTVYKHDYYGVSSVNVLKGYHVTLSETEGFRNIPIESLEWSVKVIALNKTEAITKAKNLKGVS